MSRDEIKPMSRTKRGPVQNIIIYNYNMMRFLVKYNLKCISIKRNARKYYILHCAGTTMHADIVQVYTKKKSKSKTKDIGFLIFFFSLFIAKCRCARQQYNITIRTHVPRILTPRYMTNACKHRIHLCAEHYYYFELYKIFTYPSRPITPSIGWYLVL